MRIAQRNNRPGAQEAHKIRPAAKNNQTPPAAVEKSSVSFLRWRADWEEKIRARDEEWDKVWGRVVKASRKKPRALRGRKSVGGGRGCPGNAHPEKTWKAETHQNTVRAAPPA